MLLSVALSQETGEGENLSTQASPRTLKSALTEIAIKDLPGMKVGKALGHGRRDSLNTIHLPPFLVLQRAYSDNDAAVFSLRHRVNLLSKQAYPRKDQEPERDASSETEGIGNAAGCRSVKMNARCCLEVYTQLVH